MYHAGWPYQSKITNIGLDHHRIAGKQYNFDLYRTVGTVNLHISINLLFDEWPARYWLQCDISANIDPLWDELYWLNQTAQTPIPFSTRLHSGSLGPTSSNNYIKIKVSDLAIAQLPTLDE